MGTRHFTHVEPKDSRIKWTKADPDMVRKIAAAMERNAGIVPLSTGRKIIIPILFLPLTMLYFFHMVTKNTEAPLWFSVPYIAAAILFFALFIGRYVKNIPYMYPEKRSDIWIFQAKCQEISTDYDRDHFFASFNKGGGFIQIRISHQEYDLNPVGKTYIFYKFNDKFGNPWNAILEEKMEKA
jgi:hypothetical protein